MPPHEFQATSFHRALALASGANERVRQRRVAMENAKAGIQSVQKRAAEIAKVSSRDFNSDGGHGDVRGPLPQTTVLPGRGQRRAVLYKCSSRVGLSQTATSLTGPTVQKTSVEMLPWASLVPRIPLKAVLAKLGAVPVTKGPVTLLSVH